MSARELRRQYSRNVVVEILRRTPADSSIRSDYDGNRVTRHFAQTLNEAYRRGSYELLRAIIGVELTNKRVDMTRATASRVDAIERTHPRYSEFVRRKLVDVRSRDAHTKKIGAGFSYILKLRISQLPC